MQLKMGYNLFARAGRASRTDRGEPAGFTEVGNLSPARQSARTSGEAAFAHKGGIHVSAVARVSEYVRTRRA